MPETILSRLQRYDFRRIPFSIIRTRLRELAGREGVEIDDNALTLLAREASGSMRDGERMLETAIASLGGPIDESELAAILGVASRTRIFGIITAILDKAPAIALRITRELNQSGANLESLGRDLLEMVRNLAVAKLPAANGPNILLADLPDQEATELQRLAARASARDLMRLFRLMADAQEQLARSSYPDLMLEMTMIRMATLAPVLDADELLRAIGSSGGNNSAADETGSRQSATSRPSESQSPSAPRMRSPAEGTALETSGSMTGAPSSTSTETDEAPMRRIPFEGDVKADAPRRVAAPSIVSAPESPPVSSGGGELPDLRDFIRSRRAALAGFMEQGASLQIDGDLLRVTPRSDIYLRYLTDNRNVIGDLASELYGRRIKVEMTGMGSTGGVIADRGESPNATAGSSVFAPAAKVPGEGTAAGSARVPSASTASTAGQTQADLQQKLYADPVVQRIFEEFDARLVEVKTVPNRPDASPSSVSKK
jgi:DNA polymerase-3 subunit gamma/tau